MGEAGDQRWAPFPVQDWSAMPPGSSPVDPGWAPPVGPAVPAASRRPWWVPFVVLLCLGLVVGTATWLARRAPEQRTAALGYVPGDGHAAWQRVEVTRELVTATTTQVTESARFTGTTGLLSGDSFVVTRVLHQDYDDDPSAARLWRTTTTSVDGVGVPSQSVRYYRVRGDVELAGERREDGTITAYEPALVELPADVRPGSTWSGSGTVGDALDYTSSFTAAPGRSGCLDVTGELDLKARGSGQTGRRTTLTRTWCRGQGLVASSESAGDLLTVVTPVAPPAPPPRSTTTAPITWTDPRTWTARTWDTVTLDDAGQTRGMYGSALTVVHPVLTASGLVVRALDTPDDLVATTPKTADAWTPVWTAHPGGAILSLSSFGSVVLVTTRERRLVAYSDAGQRLWQLDLPEIAPNAPIRASDGDAVLVDLSGRAVRFGLADGKVRWERKVGSDVNRAPAVGAGLVVVADRGGTVSALDVSTGAPRWDRSREASAVAVVGGQVLVVEDQNVLGMEPTQGRSTFLTHFDGRLTALEAFAGQAVVASKEATLLLDPRGRVVSRLPGYLDVDVTQSHVAGWSADRLDVVDTSGEVAASWPTRSTNLVSSERPGLATPQGVYLFGFTKGWTFDSWTTGG